MYFSAKAEYAVLAMLELATRHADTKPIQLKVIVDAHGIPDRFLVQILLQLKGAGLVHSTRGAAGGYQLARRPDEISLADIINVIDRADEPDSPRSPAKNRAAQSHAAPESPSLRETRAVWADIHAAQQKILEATTLAELVRRAQPADAFTYQI